MSITSAYSYTCAPNTGGATRLYLANVADVASFTLTGSEYSAVTMNSSAVFFEFEVETDSLEFVENTTKGDRRSYSVEHLVNGYMPNMSTSQRDALQELIDSSPCGMIAIVKDNNGNQKVVGYSENFTVNRPAYIETVESSTGATITDSNGSQFQIKSTDNELARIFTGTVPV